MKAMSFKFAAAVKIFEALDGRISKSTSKDLLDRVLADDSEFQELMDCFCSQSLRVCQSASWVVGMIADHHPERLLPFMEKMLEALKIPKHDAIIRNTVRAWQFMKIPEPFCGRVYEQCFTYLRDPKYAIAIRAFSMTVCANICKDYPELKEELILTIKEQEVFGSSGFKNRCMHTLKALS